MIEDILSSLGYIGIGGILFLVFIVFCLVKGGNNKGGNNNGGSSNNNQTPSYSTTEQYPATAVINGGGHFEFKRCWVCNRRIATGRI